MKKKTDFMDLYISEEKKKKGREKEALRENITVPGMILRILSGSVRTASLILITLLAATGAVALILDVTREPLLAYFAEIAELILKIFRKGETI